MQFIEVANPLTGAKALTARLNQELESGRAVLWLLSGGSNITIAVAVMEGLRDDLTKKLTIMLGDERFGEIGHADSNAYQLQAAGFMAKSATVLPVLIDGFDMASTRAHFNRVAMRAFAMADVVIGQFGIGSDGHIAGILPNTPLHASDDFVIGYHAEDFIRLSISFRAIKHVKVAYIFAFGKSKKTALLRLRDETIPFKDSPAQVLKELPEVYIYNDQIGDSA